MKILAAYRMQAQPIKKTDNISKAEANDGLKKMQGALDSKLAKEIAEFKHLKIYMWKRTNSRLTSLFAVDHDKVVGLMDLMIGASYIKGIKAEVLAVYLLPKYRGIGMGVEFYKIALSKFKSLSSDTSLGIAALRAWKSLSKTYKVELYSMDTSKSVPFTFDTEGMAIIDGKPLSKLGTHVFFTKKKL